MAMPSDISTRTARSLGGRKTRDQVSKYPEALAELDADRLRALGEKYLADTRIQRSEGMNVIRMPEHYGALSPILHVVPLQLLAYHTALAKGTDVDKPRNLAKSVTVE